MNRLFATPPGVSTTRPGARRSAARRILAVTLATGLALAGAAILAVPAAAATRAYGFEGATGWLGTVTADDGTRSICVNPIGLFPSGATTYVGRITSIAAETAANNGGHGGTAFTSGAALQQVNYAESQWVNTRSDVMAAALDLFAYSLIADYPGPVGSAANLDYYSERAGGSAAAVRAEEARIAATTAANWNRPAASSAPKPVIAIDDSTLAGTVTVSVVPDTAAGKLTLVGATETGSGATVIPIRNGQVVDITATPTPDAATGFTVTASVSWTVPGTPLPELGEYHTSTPKYAQLDTAPAGSKPRTISSFQTAVDPVPNTFSPVVSTDLPSGFFDVGDPIDDSVTAGIAAGSAPWMTGADDAYRPVVATGTWYREQPGSAMNAAPPASATAIGRTSLTLTGPGTYTVIGPVAPSPGAFTVVWSIDGNDQSELTRATLPSGYSWSDQFGQTAETGSARADILATTRVNTSSQGLDQPASDTVTPELGEDTTSWPSDLGGDPIEVPFVGTEYWIPGDTAPTEQAAAPTDAVVVSSVTLTATSLEPLVGPANSPHETTDGYFVWQWATPQSDYVDAWTEGFGEPGQVIRVSAPTMATSATPTVALTDRSLDTAVISGPTMGVAADLYWDAYRQTPGAPPTCGPGNRVFDSSLDPVAVTAAGSYTPPSPPTFSESGTYLWVATLASADDGTVIDQGGCGDPTEQTEVKTFGLTTLALSVAESGSGIYDVATVEGPTPVGAVLQFSAYRQSSGMPACGHEDVAYTSSLMPITGAGNYRSPSSRLPAGRYDWVATAYDRNGDVLQAGACGDHGEVSTVLSGLAFTGSQLTTASTWITAGSMALGGLMVGATLLVKRRRSRSGIRQ